MVLRSETVELLKTVPLFQGLSERNLYMIARVGHLRAVLKGHVITRQGSLGREVFVIVQGSARVERDGHLIATLQEKDCFGEMSVLDGKPRSATVTAETDVVVLVVASSAIGALMDTVPGLSRRLLATLSERLRNADIQLASRN